MTQANQPLMPLATAIWLVENTNISFEQIARFCGLHKIEVQSIADGEIGNQIAAKNPILLGQISEENIRLCEKDHSKNLELLEMFIPAPNKKVKKVRYISIAKRREKPDAIAWLLRHHPEINDGKIVKLIGTTKKTIESIRNKTYFNMHNLQPRDPVLLGLCSQIELDELIKELHRAKELPQQI